jgi:molybdopterin synthase sulfur carrier subunit
LKIDLVCQRARFHNNRVEIVHNEVTMPFIVCTQHLREVGPSQKEMFPGGTVREALQQAAQRYPLLTGYVLDDQGEVRKHVAIFIGGELQNRRTVLDRTVLADEEIYILQALSGG